MENEIDISELIHRGGILKNVEGSTTSEIYKNIVQMIDLPDCMDRDQVYNALCAREEILSTAVGNGIALPHARAPIMKDEKDQRIHCKGIRPLRGRRLRHHRRLCELPLAGTNQGYASGYEWHEGQDRGPAGSDQR